jgi:hypothetical protein
LIFFFVGWIFGTTKNTNWVVWTLGFCLATLHF